MDNRELKSLIGEVVIEHLEKSENEGLLSKNMPQEHQQELYDGFVSTFYEAITTSPNVQDLLSTKTRPEVKRYLEEKIFNAMGKTPMPPMD